MSKSTVIVTTLTASLIVLTGVADACSIACGVGPCPGSLDWTRLTITRADLIVRAAAVDYVDPTLRQSDRLVRPTRFSVQEVLKGDFEGDEVILDAYLTDGDEWNPDAPPYVRPRTSADAPCYAYGYRQGGQFLLMLRQTGQAFTTEVMPLSPVSEQLRSADDPWLQWVRTEVGDR